MVILLHVSYTYAIAYELLDISIELNYRKPSAEMQLEVTTDSEEKKYQIRRSKEKTIRRVSNEKMYVRNFCSLSRR